MEKLEEKAALLEKGEVIYIEGDIYEIRERLESVGHFFVSDVGNGRCKVTRPGRPATSSMSWITDEMKSYKGGEIKYRGNVMNLRNYVSKHNKLHGTSFSVRSTTYNVAEIYSESLDDYAVITQQQFDKEQAKLTEQLERLRSKILVQDLDEVEEDEDDEDII
jgi:hypothetical protein